MERAHGVVQMVCLLATRSFGIAFDDVPFLCVELPVKIVSFEYVTPFLVVSAPVSYFLY